MLNFLQSAENVRILKIELITTELRSPLILAGSSKATPIVAEFNIYENITLPYLTGSMSFLDDNDLYRLIKINGTEKVRIQFELPTKESEPFEKTFIIVNIPSITKINDFSSVVTVNLIEDIGYYGQLIKFSKTYNGTCEQIITKIIQDKLNRNIDTTFAKNLSEQKAFRYIVPYQTPFEAIDTILYKMTTGLGLPFFLFSSLYSDDFILRDLESIIAEQPFNKDKPFTFSQSINASNSNFVNQALSIHNFEPINLDDTLLLAQKGAIGSNVSILNASTGEHKDIHIDMDRRVNIWIENGLIPKEYSGVFINNDFIADPSNVNQQPLSDYNSRIFSTILTSRTFPYEGLEGYNEETFSFFAQNRYVRNAILNHLTKNVYQLYVPGLLFLNKDPRSTVGSQIEIRIYKNELLEGRKPVSEMIDERRSGNYIILAKRHIFDVTSDKHNVSLEISRVSELEKIQ